MMVFFPTSQPRPNNPASIGTFEVRVNGSADAATSSLRDAVKRVLPALNSSVTPTTARLAQQTARDRALAWLAFGFAAVALALASVGLYGVLSYSVSRRRREIGVRIALGALRPQVVGLIIRQGFGLMAIGLALGLAASPFISRSLQGMFFEVTPFDPLTFVTTAVTLAIVGLSASYLPARRAARVDPLETLRSE
jgi:predicted lysophospholipase L1 biosynthesis ABC-type transport system permease subunit